MGIARTVVIGLALLVGGLWIATGIRGDAAETPEGAPSGEAAGPPRADGPLDAARLDTMLRAAEAIDPLSSLLVWHRGELAVERYYRGTEAADVVNLKSVSKTLLSPLVGIAIRDSLIDSVDTPVRRLLPELYARLDASEADDPRKDRILLSDLLDMSSGLESTSFGNYGAWASSPDWGWDQLRRPLECDPGACYRYSTGVTHLLGIALARAAGTDLRSYAQAVLYDSLGITLSPWDRDPQGHYLGGNNMSLRPKDLLSIGVLYANDGRHDGRQVVPAEWIEASWQPKFRSPWNGQGYGGLWWTALWGEETAHSAWGYGGQFLVIVPRLNLVVVATSALDRGESGHTRRMRRFFDQHVVPAFRPVR